MSGTDSNRPRKIPRGRERKKATRSRDVVSVAVSGANSDANNVADRPRKITITGRDGDFLLIRSKEGFTGRIHASLVAGNGLVVTNGKIVAPGSLYAAWFADAIREARQAAFRDACDRFYSRVPLFVANREAILGEPRFYSIVAPRGFYNEMLGKNPRVTLGELLRIWEREKCFHGVCPVCGGDVVITYFGGSPFTGAVYEKSGVCLACGKECTPDGVGGGVTLSTLFNARRAYRPLEPAAVEPAPVEELAAFLEGRPCAPGESGYTEENTWTL